MRLSMIALALFTLAACGADGVPEAPASKAETATGITLSGCATLGLTTGAATKGRVRC